MEIQVKTFYLNDSDVTVHKEEGREVLSPPKAGDDPRFLSTYIVMRALEIFPNLYLVLDAFLK